MWHGVFFRMRLYNRYQSGVVAREPARRAQLALGGERRRPSRETMSVWDDDEEKYDLSRKGKSDEPSDFDRAMMMKSSEDEPAGPSSEPSWAAAYKAAEAEKKKRKPTRLSGTVITWNKGFGFIKVPGQADLYVHQRNIEKKGFRSLLEGEPVEFVMAKMADGKLEALNVTGPGGVEPQGQPTPAEREEMEEEEEERARAKAVALAKMEAERPKKPATAFVPRTVKRPAPKSTARPAVKKPAPSAPAPADGLASAAPAAAPAAPETAD